MIAFMFYILCISLIYKVLILLGGFHVLLPYNIKLGDLIFFFLSKQKRSVYIQVKADLYKLITNIKYKIHVCKSIHLLT